MAFFLELFPKLWHNWVLPKTSWDFLGGTVQHEVLFRGLYYKYYPHAHHLSSFSLSFIPLCFVPAELPLSIFHRPPFPQTAPSSPFICISLRSGREEQIAHLYPLHSKDKMDTYGFSERICPIVFSKKGVFSIWVRIIQSCDLAILSVLGKQNLHYF